MEFRGSEGSVLSWKTTLGGRQSNIQFKHPELEMPGSFAAENESTHLDSSKNMWGERHTLCDEHENYTR